MRYPFPMTQDSPSRRQDQFVLRLPDGMRDRIAEAAKQSGRSMNAEIVQALAEKYPQPINQEIIDALKRYYEDQDIDNFKSLMRCFNNSSLNDMFLLNDYGFDVSSKMEDGGLTVSVGYNPAKKRRSI